METERKILSAKEEIEAILKIQQENEPKINESKINEPKQSLVNRAILSLGRWMFDK